MINDIILVHLLKFHSDVLLVILLKNAKPSLVAVMACRLINKKSLPEPMENSCTDVIDTTWLNWPYWSELKSHVNMSRQSRHKLTPDDTQTSAPTPTLHPHSVHKPFSQSDITFIVDSRWLHVATITLWLRHNYIVIPFWCCKDIVDCALCVPWAFMELFSSKWQLTIKNLRPNAS